VHFPDPETPLEETLGALQELLDEGTVRAIGCSNFTAEQLREAEQLARASGRPHFSALQNNYNLLEREAEQRTLPLCREYGIGFVPYFPLASGLLTGKYRRGQPIPEGTRLSGRTDVFTDDAFDRIEALDAFARERDLTLLHVAIGGVVAQPAVASVIAGATRPEQVRANVAAGEWEPSAYELAALNEIR
jgi:aryl-alcohol dehydrogenase-like predicted oxidoreductase